MTIMLDLNFIHPLVLCSYTSFTKEVPTVETEKMEFMELLIKFNVSLK